MAKTKTKRKAKAKRVCRWKAERSGSIGGAEGIVLYEILDSKGTLIASDVSEKHAPLIAAVPDVVAALQFCQSVLRSHGLFELSERIADDKATKALAHARGEK